MLNYYIIDYVHGDYRWFWTNSKREEVVESFLWWVSYNDEFRNHFLMISIVQWWSINVTL